MVAPFIAGMLILEFIPAIAHLPLAFTSYNALEPPVFIGLDNFRELIHDRIFWIAVGNSLLFIAIGVPLRIAGAVLLALLLLKPRRGTGFFRAAVYVPTVVPEIAWAVAWLWILNPIYGPLNLGLDLLGLPSPALTIGEWPPRFAIILVLVFQLGEGFVVSLAALSDVPRDLLDQAAVDGSTPRQAFVKITIPLLAPTLLVLLLRDAIVSLQANFTPALIIGRNGGPNHATTYLPFYIYREAFAYLRFGYAAAMTWFLFLLTGAVLFLLYRAVSHWRLGFADVE
jgi:multiple sugar transport system permease protein